MSTAPQLTPAQLNYAETAQWKAILKQAITDLRVSIPAIVQSVDYTANPPVVTVTVAIQEVVRTADGPQNKTIYPISNVPIVLPSAGGFSLTLPVTAGDEGLLTFCDMCIDLWWKRGGIQPQFERRRHDLSDCGFAPGMRSQKRPLSNWSQNSAQLRSDDGTTYIEIAAGGVVNIVAPGGLNVNGAVVATGEVTGNGIPLSTHIHGGIYSGGSFTDEPTA